MKKFVILLFLLFTISKLIAEQSVSGIVTDTEDNPIVGVNVLVEGTFLGAATDSEGYFRIFNIPVTNITISLLMIGYEEAKIEVQLEPNETKDLGTIVLQSTTLQSSPVVITASRFKQKITETPVSVTTIDKQQIKMRNSTSVEKAIQYESGINMNQDQINIRGSSGYSRGVGSRVMMLIDGVPFITGDTQGTVPEAIAMNQIENIEIVKGASSALYGSSAIGGVINIITKSISLEPEYNFKFYGGLYDDPYYNQWKWSEKSRYRHGIKADFSKKIENTGIRFAISQDKDESYRKNDWSNRVNLSAKIEQQLSPFEKLSVSSNFMDQSRGNFLYWQNLENALVPASNQLDDKIHSVRYFVSPSYTKIVSDSSFFKINTIWFHNFFDDNIDQGNKSTSDNAHLAFQYNSKLKKHILVLGFNADYNTVTSNIFGTRKGYGLGLFAQDEITWNDQWSTVLGLRLDYFDIDNLGSDLNVNPRVGMVYHPNTNSAFRLSFGTGFRAPSMAEAFTSTVASGITVIPNENLKPEKSYSTEVGLNQIISEYISGDIALFYSRYFDLIESGFTSDLKAQFNNVTDAEISGLDVSLNLEILEKVIKSKIGYTFLEPRDITKNNSKYLKYRPKHLFNANTYLTYENFIIGADYRYISKYEAIDEEFASIITDGNEVLDVHVIDLRCMYEFNMDNLPLIIALQVNNLLQYNYIDLIGSIAPIRNYELSLEIGI